MVDERCSCADDALPRAMKRLQVLLLGGFDWDESHRRAQGGFDKSPLRPTASFLDPFTNGFTNQGLISRTRRPSARKRRPQIMGAGASFHSDGFRSELP